MQLKPILQKLLLFVFYFALSFATKAQVINYNESVSGDLSSNPCATNFTVAVGTNTWIGIMEPTPSSQADRWKVTVPAGMQISSLAYARSTTVGGSLITMQFDNPFIGVGTTGTTLNQIFSPAKGPGTYCVDIFTDFNTNSTQWGLYLVVEAIPPTPTISASGPTTFCAGGSVMLTSSSATGNFWSNGATTQSITVNTAGTYSVYVNNAGVNSASSLGTTVTVNPLPATPTITASGPTTFCAGGSVTLTSSSATGNVWSNGATTQSITVTTGGTYTVLVTIGGCSSSSSAGTIVTVNPLPAASASSNSPVCIGSTLQLTGTGVGTYLWTNEVYSIFPFVSTAQNPSIPNASTLNDTYYFTVTDGNGCSRTVETFVVFNPRPPTPTITASGPTTFCAGDSVTLTKSSFGLWSTGAVTPSIKVKTAGTYSVTVGTASCSSSASRTVTVNPIPSTPTITAGGPTTFCAGGSVTLTSSSTTGNVWSNGATTQSITVTTGGTYTVLVTIGGCSSSSSAGTTITVNPLPTVDSVANQTICIGANTTAVAFAGALAGTTYNWTNSNTAIGLAASGTGDIPSFAGTNTGTTSITGTVTVTPLIVETFGTITVTSALDASDPTLSSRIYRNGVAGICPGPKVWPGFSGAGPYFYETYSYTNSSAFPVCVTTSLTSTTTNQAHVIAYLGSFNPASQDANFLSDCGSSTFGPAKSMAFNAPVGATIVFIVLEPNPSEVCPSYTLTIDGLLITIPTCIGTPITYTYTVNPTPTAVATPATETICSGATITTKVLSGAVAGTVYNWTRDNTTAVTGIAASGSGDISGVLNNTTAAPVTVTFTITPSYTNAGTTCTGTPITATVVVNPVPNAIATPATQTICSATNITTIALSSSVAGTTYNWTRDNTATATGIAASGSGNISGALTNTTTAPITVTFTITPVAVGGCTVVTTTATVIVNPTPTVNTVTSQVVCNNAATTAVNFTSPTTGGSIVYNWTNSTTSIGLAASGSGNIASFNAINTTTAPITATITVTPTLSSGASNIIPVTATTNMGSGFGSSITNTVNGAGLSVFPSLTATHSRSLSTNSWVSNDGILSGSVTFSMGELTTVNGFSFWNINGPASEIGIKNVQILSSTDGVAFVPIIGAPSVFAQIMDTSNSLPEIFSFPAINATHIRFAIANNHGDLFLTGFAEVAFSGLGRCVGSPTTYTYTVNPTATVNAVTSQVICNNAATTAVNFTSPTTGGTIVYNWINNTTSIGLGASGIGNIPTFTATNTTTAPVTATITVTPSYTNAGVTCIGTARTFTITVNPTVTVNAVTNQVVCNNAATTAINFSSPTTGGTIVYNWTNNTTSIGLAASGSGNIPSFFGTNTTTAPVTATITVTPSYTNAGVTCIGTARTFTITVNPTATVNAITNQVVCNNAATTAVNFSSPTTGGTIVYNWISNNTSIGLGASGIGNIQTFTATNTTTAPVTATITVTPSYTNAGVTCIGTAITFTITVNPTATVNVVTSQVVCNATPTTAITFSSPTIGGTIVYNWTNNNTSIGLGASGIGNIPTFTATNTTTAPVTATITVTPSYTNAGVTCVGTPRTYTYTVNPVATVSALINQVVCNASPTTTVTFTSPTIGGTIVYNWTNNNTSIGLGASGIGNIPTFTATNTTTAPVTATITVTPSYTNGAVTCIGTASTFTITVNPTAIVNPIANQVLCNSFSTTAVNFSSPTTGGTIVYNWTNSAASIGLAASGSGNFASFVATNTTQLPIMATITVTPSYTNGAVTCVGTPRAFIITVNPTPIVSLAPFAAICKNAAAITLTGGSPVAATGTTGVYTVDGTIQTIFNPANYTQGLHYIIYTYTNIYGCVNTASQTILVHPIHNVEITVAPNTGLAPGSPATINATVSPSDNYTYIWSKNNATITSSPINTDRIVVLANDAGTYSVRVIAPTGCSVTSASVFTTSSAVPTTLFVFPNPSSGLFNVAYNNGAANLTKRTLNVYTALGQKVYSKQYDVNVPFGNMQVDLINKAAGVYVIELVDSNGIILGSARIVKR
jgi:PKD-like domain/Secretion system C-terminal sorting domain